MSRKIAVGLDIGTTTLCMIVLDAETGKIMETLTEQNNAEIRSRETWEKLQDPSLIMSKVEQMLLQIKIKYPSICCMGLTGQMHGIVYINNKGKAVSPLFTWQDGRGNQEYQEGLSYAAYLSGITNHKLATGYGAVTHFYNTVNKKVPAQATSFCTIMDYVALQLTDVFKPLIHPSNAASIGLFNIKTNTFDTEAIERAGLDQTFFPEVSVGINIMGKTLAQVPVAVAIGDNQASFIGAVKSNEDCLLINIGTSSQISVYTPSYRPSCSLETRPLIENDFIVVGAPLCGGRAYALLEGFFREIVEAATSEESPKLYTLMGDLASDFLELEEPLEIATQFCGTRNQPELRGEIKQLGTNNFTPKHFTIGVLQGMVSELYTLYLSAQEGNVMPATLVGSGNGLRMNKPLQQMIAKAFNQPIQIPRHKEEASYGVALFALVGCGIFKNLEEAQKLIQYQETT